MRTTLNRSFGRGNLLFAAALVSLGIANAAPWQDPPAEDTPPDVKPEKTEPNSRRSSRPESPPRTGESRPGDSGSKSSPNGRHARVEIEVVQGEKNLGIIVIELDDRKAPVSVSNFLQYVDDGFYDGTMIHRVLNPPRATIGIIQAGGYTSPTERKETTRRPIRCEATNGLKNLRGTVAMARTKDPNSATCQFFINTIDNPDLDHPGPENWGNFGAAVFGKVVDGMEVVDKLKELKTRTQPLKPEEQSQPMDIVRIKSARRATAEKARADKDSGDDAGSRDEAKDQDQEPAPEQEKEQKPD